LSNIRVTYSGLIGLFISFVTTIIGMIFVLITTRQLSEIELGTAHDFSPGTTIAIGNGTLTPCGKFGTQIKIQLGASLSAGTRYFLRVGSTVGGTNEGGKSLTTNVTWFNSFTTAA